MDDRFIRSDADGQPLALDDQIGHRDEQNAGPAPERYFRLIARDISDIVGAQQCPRHTRLATTGVLVACEQQQSVSQWIFNGGCLLPSRSSENPRQWVTTFNLAVLSWDSSSLESNPEKIHARKAS